MGKIDTAGIKYLGETYGDHINFRKSERKLYSHDIAAMPPLVKPFIDNTVPDAVIQPETEEELIKIVRWGAERRIPLTPRGKASSGYGGVIPLEQGLVIDFRRMNRIINIDAKAQTVTVEAGIVWEALDSKLAECGLTLRLYPTSYPASTVGGWLAQGGAGIGSYEMGWFRENVISARIITPDGAVKEMKGAGLDLVSDAEGTTGLISQVTIRVQPLEEMKVEAIACPDAASLQQTAQAIIKERLPVWSFVFINPKMAKLRNQSPLMEHNGHPSEERILLPEKYIITLAFRKKDAQAVMSKLPEIIKQNKAEMLDERIAEHEWHNRFKLMIVKRLGPSLVPAEIVVPLDSIGSVMTEIEKKITQPVVKEGIIIANGAGGKAEAVILGFIPSDQRKPSYNFVFGLVLTILKIAEKHGGRPYSTGMYFGSKANEILGAGRAQKLKEFKKKTDPENILNPGKVFGGTVSNLLGFAGIIEPIARAFGNRMTANIGERPDKPVRGIPADVAWYAYACSQCGYCIEECAQFYGRGWESQSPRGKWYWLREYMEGKEEWDQFMVDSILSCTTCELCNRRCSASLPIEPSWMKLRGKLIQDSKRMTFPPFEMMTAALKKEGDIWAGYRKDRAAWFPQDLQEKHGSELKSKAVYFAGCTASYVEHDIALASVRLLDAAGADFTYLGEKENCCGTPMLVAGKWDTFAEVVKANIKAVKDAGADTVITSCPACDMMWRHTYADWAKKLGIEYNIKTKHYSEIIAEKLASGEFAFPKQNGHQPYTVTWHDSCHIGRVSGVYEAPRQVIRALPGVKFVEMSHNHESSHCCGSVLTLIKDPPVAAEIGKMRLDEAVAAGAEKILALCPCCEFQLRVSANKKNMPIEVVDLARLAASSLGYKFPDPNPEVQRQWAVFEAMIALMTPAGFAQLMGTMWPELIDAMPFGMGEMMRAMGKIPGSLNLMKPMFPVLFPKLLPMMMPKVMPVMLKRVAERIPMPDYMAEQMPELMHQVMENLMPHMIGDVVPLVTQPMIDYLSGKR